MNRQRQIEFYAWNMAARRSIEDYAAHPTEFNKSIYCIECSEPKRGGVTQLRCAPCDRKRQVLRAS